MLGSSLTGRGLDELWTAIEHRLATRRADGSFAARRAQQADDWLDTAVREQLLGQFLADPATAQALRKGDLIAECYPPPGCSEVALFTRGTVLNEHYIGKLIAFAHSC